MLHFFKTIISENVTLNFIYNYLFIIGNYMIGLLAKGFIYAPFQAIKII